MKNLFLPRSRKRTTGKLIVVQVIASLWALGLSVGLGKDAVEVESHYAGDGWFEYRLRTMEDPFFAGIEFGQLLPSPFTNYVENTLAPHWTNYFYKGKWTGLMYDASVPQPRLNEISFSVRSSSTHFRREQYGFGTMVYYEFTFPYQGLSGLGGYLNLNCLVPCAPEEADGSPDTLVSRMEVIPDIKIDELILTNGQVCGVTFSWVQPSTVELQRSEDLGSWETVARLFGDPPQTTWTTNVSLGSSGTFFRLLLVAASHVSEAPAATLAAGDFQTIKEIPVVDQRLMGGQIRIGFPSAPNALYEVEHCEWRGDTIATKRIRASERFTPLVFETPAPHRAGFFKVQVAE